MLISVVLIVVLWSMILLLFRVILVEYVCCVIDSCDFMIVVGLCDWVVLLLLVCLGLCGGEVIMLWLDDIDWDVGCLCVCGKNGRECWMFLLVDVGEVIVDYLCSG